jgi:hypothetical protein
MIGGLVMGENNKRKIADADENVKEQIDKQIFSRRVRQKPPTAKDNKSKKK